VKGFEYKIKAIPTMFQGIQMRSRLEARWAAFFTECGWEWTYEPFDFDGWCPDFLLKLHRPVLVEVKPQITEATIEELLRVSKRLRDAPPIVLVGDAPAVYPGESAMLFGRWITDMYDGTNEPVLIGECGANGLGCSHGDVGLSELGGQWTCWVCGKYDGSTACNADDARIAERWAKACNDTQWNPPKAAAPSRRPKTPRHDARCVCRDCSAEATRVAAAQAAAAQATLRALPKKLLQKGMMRAAARGAAARDAETLLEDLAVTASEWSEFD
jgi:hypothetical protein